jgi:hypothetical protein
MTFQITRTHKGRTAVLKNPITMKAHTFETREDAARFASSCFQTERCDWKNEGRRLAKYEVREV